MSTIISNREMTAATSGAPTIYSAPRTVTDINECHFYCVVDIPGHGTVGEAWDLRGKEDEYLGGVSFKGKRVLELGTASGYLCRYMERQGALVIGFDLSEKQSWDLVPFARFDLGAISIARKEHIRRINNSWWFCHRLFNSRAKMVYGSVYEIPRQVGPVDVVTMTSMLLHLRDPFLALQNACQMARETVVVTDVHPDQSNSPAANRPIQVFHPNFRVDDPHQCDRWWLLFPETIIEFLGVLGFEKTQLTFHQQHSKNNGQCRFYTIVATRTRGSAVIQSAPALISGERYGAHANPVPGLTAYKRV
jgi:hypothetical protein